MDHTTDSIRNLQIAIETAGFSTEYKDKEDNPYYHVSYNKYSAVTDFESMFNELYRAFVNSIHKSRASNAKLIEDFDFIQSLWTDFKKKEQLIVTRAGSQNPSNKMLYHKNIFDEIGICIFYDEVPAQISNFVKVQKKYLEFTLEFLHQELELIKSVMSNPISKNDILDKILCFEYNNMKQDPFYIETLRRDLISEGFLSEKVKRAEFEKLFNGSRPTSPVKWEGSKSELRWLIRTLKRDLKILDIIGNDNSIWKLTCRCFVDSKGGKYDWKQFRGLKEPKTKDIIEKICSQK